METITTVVAVGYLLLLGAFTALAYFIGYYRAEAASEVRIRVEKGKQNKLLVTISEEVVRTVDPELTEPEVKRKAKEMMKIATPPDGITVVAGRKNFHVDPDVTTQYIDRSAV